MQLTNDKYDAHNNLVYKPPPLDEVWLDAEGREQSKIELRKQHKRNEELLRNREVATKDMVQTPATQGGHVPSIPTQDGALISSDDDSFISDNESEGGFGDTNADNDGSDGIIPNEGVPGVIPNEGAPVVIPNEGAQGPNFAIDGEGRRRSSRRRDPIERLIPGTSNVRGYPETVWRIDNGRLERFNLWSYRRSQTKLAKLNRDIFTLTFGNRQIPAHALIQSKKRKRIKFKQYRRVIVHVDFDRWHSDYS